MTAPSGLIASVYEAQLPIVLNRTLTHTFSNIDPAFERMQITSEGVVKEGFSRDYSVRKIFTAGTSGMVSFDPSQKTVYGDAMTSFAGIGATFDPLKGFVDPRQGLIPTPFQMEITLTGLEASLMLTKEILNLKSFQAVGDMWEKIVMGWANNIKRTRATAWYTADSTYAISTIASAGTDADGTVDDGQSAASGGIRYIWVRITDGTINRLEQGMPVDVRDKDSGDFYIRRNDVHNIAANQTVGSRLRLFVGPVDRGRKVAMLWSPDMTEAQMESIVATDKIHWPNTKGDGTSTTFYHFLGLNSFIRRTQEPTLSTTVLGVDVAQHPEFSSINEALNGVLTQQVLRKYLSKFSEVYGPYGYDVDTGLCRRGVYNNYLTNYDVISRRDTTNQPLTVANEGSRGRWAINHDGMGLDIGLSDFCNSGEFYMLKMKGGNWKRYVPPSVGGSGGGPANIPAYMEFEFIGSELGYTGTKIPIMSSDGTPTRGFGFYGESRMQCVADQWSCVKLTGVTEDEASVTLAAS